MVTNMDVMDVAVQVVVKLTYRYNYSQINI